MILKARVKEEEGVEKNDIDSNYNNDTELDFHHSDDNGNNDKIQKEN